MVVRARLPSADSSCTPTAPGRVRVVPVCLPVARSITASCVAVVPAAVMTARVPSALNAGTTGLPAIDTVLPTCLPVAVSITATRVVLVVEMGEGPVMTNARVPSLLNKVEPTPETPTLPIFVTDVAMSEGCTSTRTVRSVASVTYTAPLGATATA